VSGQPIELGPRLISQQLLDRFRVVTILGEGPIGIVVKVEEVTTGNHYAAKLIHPQYTRGNPSADKLLKDAEKCAEIECEHLAKVVKVGRDTGSALTVIRELMTGECLEERLDETPQLSLTEAVSITRQILLALDAIHQAGLLNLDLSPADVFLAKTPNGETVKLVDVGEHHIKQQLVFESGDELESRNYYAPEQYDRSRQPNARADLYAAGAVLYQMVTGTVPSGTPAPASELRSDLPTGLAQVISKAIAATASNRFQTAEEFIAALDNPDAMTEQQSVAAQPSNEPAEETSAEDQPSVIVDMPEMKSGSDLLSSTRARIATGAGAALVIAVVLFVTLSGTEKEPGDTDNQEDEMVSITINLEPASADILLDGKPISGRPPVIERKRDNKLHTIRAKAEGFESLERDVRFTESRTIEIRLDKLEIPDTERDGPAVEEIVETDTAASTEGSDSSAQPTVEEIPSEPTEAGDVVEIPSETSSATAAQATEGTPPTPASTPSRGTNVNTPSSAAQKPAEDISTKKVEQAPKKQTTKARKPKPKKKKKKTAPKKPKKKTRDGFSANNPFG